MKRKVNVSICSDNNISISINLSLPSAVNRSIVADGERENELLNTVFKEVNSGSDANVSSSESTSVSQTPPPPNDPGDDVEPDPIIQE